MGLVEWFSFIGVYKGSPYTAAVDEKINFLILNLIAVDIRFIEPMILLSVYKQGLDCDSPGAFNAPI